MTLDENGAFLDYDCYKTLTGNPMIRYDTIRYAILTRNKKVIRVSLIYRTEPTTNKKLSYRRGTARCVVSIEILPIANSATVQKVLIRQVLAKSMV